MWSTISSFLGASTRPFYFTQYFWWIPKFLPLGPNLHIVVVAAFCWSIWKTRNRSCFEGKLISSPVELITCVLFFGIGQVYWVQASKRNNGGLVGVLRLQQAAAGMYEMARRNSTLRLKEADSAEGEEVIVIEDVS
jgi:hypothetical protein